MIISEFRIMALMVGTFQKAARGSNRKLYQERVQSIAPHKKHRRQLIHYCANPIAAR
jgi:hypothetical protein